MSLPVTRPSGRALLVSHPATRSQAAEALQKLGYACGEADDPYAAMAELCRRPLVYQAVILSLASLYREELTMIRAIKQRFPHAEVWLTHTDGRQSALAEAMRLGADGLLDEEGLHRIAMGFPNLDTASSAARASIDGHSELGYGEPRSRADRADDIDDPDTSNEPILSADELRALLHEQPSMPPAGEDEH